ncbi:MAG: class I SAM-dependent methyltransferase [Bacteroidales bacterium]|nr:class I SAM-dependent methyltransferase [Bacteroidales bacterium]
MKEDRKNQPKEYFKFLAKRARPLFENLKNPTVLDIGCATGDFIYYLKDRFPYAEFTGSDVVQTMIDNAQKKYPDTKFINMDITNDSTFPSHKYDIIFMSGVIYLFEDFKPWINNLKKLLTPQGKAFVFSNYNPEPIDMILHVNPVDENYPGKGSVSYFSKKRLGNYLNEINAKFEFIDWEITIPLEKKENDPLRSWTIKDEHGKYLLVSGMQFIQTCGVLEISF